MSAMVPFRKMHGLGNDFVVLDARAHPATLTPQGVRAAADRHRGIGCDQLIVVEAPRQGGHARLTFWNADGSVSGACGNGTRCVAGWLMESESLNRLTLETANGTLHCEARAPGMLAVNMGEPKFDWRDIPLAQDMDTLSLDLTDRSHGAVLERPSAVNMGNPHCVYFVPSLDDIALAHAGPALEHHRLFPERANISMAEVLSRGHVRARVWERGAGLTLACGSAACAILVAAVRRDLADPKATITMPGGDLTVEWRASDNCVILAGPWTESFHGVIPADTLKGAGP